MKRVLIHALLAVFALTLLVLIGCSGDSSSPPTPITTTKTGYLVGSLIENMPYTCGSLSGRTGRIGQFSYHTGQSCTFTLGKNSFSVGADKLQKGYISAYDLTATQQEAWTLTAIINSISHKRPNSDLIVIIDNNLERRIPAVDLKQGDTAVAAALQTFLGTVTAVSVSDARQRLAKTVKDDNTLLVSREQLEAQGMALLDSLQIHVESGKPWGVTTNVSSNSVFGRWYAAIASRLEPWLSPTKAYAMTNHDNRVNLRFYDYQGNPFVVSSNTYDSKYVAGFADQWLWVTSGQNPNNSVPYLGLYNGDIYGSNILGIDLYVGRSDSTDVANSFRSYAQWLGNGQFGGSPVSVFAAGAKNDQQTTNGFPQQLNFGYMFNMYTAGVSSASNQYSSDQGSGKYATGFYCPDLMLGQGSTKASLTQWLDSLKSLGDVISDAAEAASEEGVNIMADAKLFYSFAEFTETLGDLATQNWWMMTNATHTTNARITLRKNPGMLTRCYPAYTYGTIGNLSYSPDYNNPMVAVVTSTLDDHTFDVYVAFPWQKLQGVTLSN